MKPLSLTIVIILFVMFFVSGFSVVSAQYTVPIPTEVSVDISPEYPGPNSQVSVVIDSYGTDLNAAFITWKVNGVTKKSGNGLKTFSFTTGDMNVNTKLDIVIKTKEGEVITKTYNIKSAGVDLIWQTEGYTPPFYKGKALMSYQNKIQFVAIPHILGSNGQEISADKLIYKWTRNGTVMGDFSGYGRNTYTHIPSIISRPLDIEVEVTSPDTGGVGYAKTNVQITDPLIVMYEKNPLYGIQFQKALSGTFEMGNSKEITIVGEPYYFGTASLSGQNLAYKWTLNGIKIENGDDQTTKVFRTNDNSSGSSYISLSIENATKILQYQSTGFTLHFGTITSNDYATF